LIVTTLEVAVVVLETGTFRKLGDFVLHVLYGPVIERIPEFVVRSGGHAVKL
jgi:hypothetical protein